MFRDALWPRELGCIALCAWRQHLADQGREWRRQRSSTTIITTTTMTTTNPQNIFADLQEGKAAYIDPNALTGLLGLEVGWWMGEWVR